MIEVTINDTITQPGTYMLPGYGKLIVTRSPDNKLRGEIFGNGNYLESRTPDQGLEVEHFLQLFRERQLNWR